MAWIRSQNKKILMEIKKVEITRNNIIVGFNGNFETLGIYSTEKKALEVMDRLQEHIAQVNSHQNDCYGGLPHIDYSVFQMPANEEV